MRVWTAACLVLVHVLTGCAEPHRRVTGTSAALSLPSGFIEEPLGGNWNQAVGLTFDASGNLFVWEKAGRVWRVRADGTREPIPLLDLHEEVGDWRDHGMLGFALHPNFLSNGYIYALYAVDYHHLRQFGTPGYDSGQDDYFVDTQVRLTRYEARASDGFQSVDLASRRVLFGEEMGSGCPLHHQSHGAGSLVFGNDGTLLVTCGDGGSYEGIDDGGDIGGSSNTALGDGIITAAEDVGAFRAQLVDSMAGKVLRLDAATGDGVASNPFYDASAPRSARSRVWALGMRNPFRATLRPGTGAHDPAEGNPGVLYVGDVGWTLFEELDVVSGPGQNFGWPLFEGLNQPGPYSVNSAANLGAPNPLFGTTPPGRPLCSQQYFMFRELLVQDTTNALSFPNGCDPAQQIPPPRFEHTRPVLDWQHGEPLARVPSYSPSGLASVRSLGIDAPVVGNAFEGNSVTGGVWYVGSDFPETFRNTYFVADYDRGWVKNLVFDDQNRLLEVRDFSPSGNGALVAMATNPVEGGLYYITYANVVRRIRHVGGGNRAPLASVSADVTFGPSPLQVQLDGSQSRDPELGALTYEWNFGDGSPPSTAQSPVHNFDFGSNAPHTYVVSLRVTDVVGASNTATLQIVVNNAPPAVSLVSPIDGDVFSVTGNAETALLAAPFDGEQSAPELSCQWQTILHHNAHAHPEPPLEGCTQTVVVSPVPCDDEDYNYEFVVTVDDGAGLSATESSVLYPDCSPGALEPQGVTASTAPTFRWRRVQGADQYEVVVHDSATQGLISAVYAAAEVSCTSGPRCSLLAPVTLALGDASFTVRAHNPVAGWRGWSQPAAFIVSDAQPPPPPPPPAGSNLALTGTPIAAVTSPIGGGSPNLAIIRDGIKPEVGSTSSATQYDTYHGSAPASVDWVGYTFGGNQNFASVVFQEGLHFFDGGWFDTLTVQVRQAGV